MGSKEGPKSIKFSRDEKYCARLASRKTIAIYEDGDFNIPKYKIKAGPPQTAQKQNDTEQTSKQKKEDYKFDGFQLIPSNPDIPA